MSIVISKQKLNFCQKIKNDSDQNAYNLSNKNPKYSKTF